MSTNKISKILIVLISTIFISCCFYYNPTLKEADSIMETQPEKAAEILKHINRDNLREHDFPYYALLQTQADIKNGFEIASDSLISLSLNIHSKRFKKSISPSKFLWGAYCTQSQRTQISNATFLKCILRSKKQS